MNKAKHRSLLAILACLLALLFSVSVLGACGSNETADVGENANGTWYYGVTAPAAELGENGDHYLNTETLTAYAKTADGTWQPTTLYSGAEAPDASAGETGDLYLDTKNGVLYQKGDTLWSIVLTLKGTPGRDGVVWFSGEKDPEKDDPTLADARNGDFYLNTKDFTVWQLTEKTGGELAWNKLGSIKGHGTTWFKGMSEPDEAGLADVFEGDFYYRSYIDMEAQTSNYQIYHYENGEWVLETTVVTGSLKEFSGADGESYLEVDDDGTVTVTGAAEGTTELNVPGTLNGKHVKIGENAFRGNQELTSVALESGVEEIGDMAFYGCTHLTSVTLSEGLDRIGEGAFASSGITEVALPEGLTEIGTAAFNGTKLTEVAFPSSVTTIGDYAFQYTGLQTIDFSKDEELYSIGNYAFGNTKLSSVDLSQNQKLLKVMQGAFSNCTSLTEITLPSGGAFRAIEGSAFEGCSTLAAIEVPDGTTFIGSTAFKDCTALETITLPDTITTIGSDDVLEGTLYYNTEDNWTDGVLYVQGRTKQYLFKADPEKFTETNYVIPDNTQVIANSAFSQCKTMTEVDVPASVVSIGGGAFVGCEALTTVNLHSGLKTMGRLVFQDCGVLQTVTLPDTLTEIGYGTFNGCKALKSVNIPASVKKIEEGAFYKFNGDVTVAEGNENYALKTDAESVKYITGHENDNTDVVKLVWVSHSSPVTSFTIPGDVTRVGAFVFAECPDLAKIVIPETVTEISYGAFENCAFTDVKLPSGLTLLDGYAFYNCNNLTEIVIPDGVSIIGSYAFWQCDNLQEVTIGSGVMTIGSYAFASCPKLDTVTFAEGSLLDEIAPYAFGNCQSLTSIALPETVYEVFQNAFNGSGLTELTIKGDGSNMLWLHQDALAGCSQLTTIHFGGTETQWKDLLTRESDFVKKTKGTITVHCSDGTDLTYVNGALQD